MLTLSDRPILYRLRILKTDRETGKTITLAHTSFKLKDANGETVRQTVHYPTEKEIDTFTTDETGGVTLPETLRWGLYYIEEISAPEGYLIQTESLPVMIGHDGDEPGQTYELNIEMQVCACACRAGAQRSLSCALHRICSAAANAVHAQQQRTDAH